MKCHWDDNNNSCEETKCSDLTTSSACEVDGVVGNLIRYVWVTNFCFDFSPWYSFGNSFAYFSFLNDDSVIICMWVESDSFRGCFNRVDSCVSVHNKNVCLSVSGCEWSENDGCVDRRDVQEGSSSFAWWVFIVIGINRHNIRVL
jgi:hypothetical protein